MSPVMTALVVGVLVVGAGCSDGGGNSGGGGGGRPTLAQAGGKDASKLSQVLDSVPGWVEEKII